MTDYYVSTTGNDNNTGTSGSPFATITYAATRCVAGDIVHVNDGTYNLSQGTYTSGTAGNPITYKAVNKGQAKIVGTTDDPWYNQGNYVVIDGFDITNGVSSGIHGINNYGSNVTIQNCTIHDILLNTCPGVGGAGIFEGGYNNSVEQVNCNILNNVIYNIGPTSTCTIVHGIYATSSGGVIANNLVYAGSGYAIHMWHAATDKVVSNNLLFAGRYGGILVGNDGLQTWATTNNNTVVANNIVYNNATYGIREFGNTGLNNRYLNNCVKGSTNGVVLLNGLTNKNTVTDDPAFVNYQANGSGNYHLSSSSPCIGAGTQIGAYTTDAAGSPRPARPFRFDIGPYIYQATINGPVPAIGVYDPTSHQVVAAQAGTVVTDSTTGIAYAPLNSSSGSSGANASVGTDGSAIPASSTLVGASDGTNLQQLLVESASNRNLRIGIYSGANEATVTGANALKVDNSGVTQPVSVASLPLPTGAATAAKQPALGTAGTASADVLTVQGITSMTPLKTDGSATTQPVSAASLPLPAGAATAAKQPALGTAGTASTDVITVQGIASMTALKVDGSAVTQPISAASLPLPTGAATSAKQPALGTAGTPSSDVLTVQGATSMIALKVDGSGTTQPVSGTVTANAGTGNYNNASVGTDGSAIPTASTLVGASDGTNLQQLLVESSSNRNLRIGIYSGANEATVTGANALKVDGSGVTQPISVASLPLPSGASTSAKQPALGTAGSASSDVLTVQGIASMTALKVDGSSVTQPVSAASLPLPTGAATSAKQPALGTAGSASTDVITVQGIASMTPLKVDGSAVTQPVSAASLPLPTGAATSAKQPALGTAGTASSDVLTVQGITSMTALKVDGSGTTQPVSGTVTANAGTGNFNNAAVGTDGSAIPTSSMLVGASDGTNLQQLLVESASNRNLRVGLYNGVNEASVDSSGSLYTRGNFTEQASLSAGSLNADLVASTDVSAYKWFSLQVTGTWSGTLTFQACNDNSNFVNIYVYQLNNVTNYTFAYTANAIYTASIAFRYLRVRMTSYSSGTANGVLELYTSPPTFLPTIYANQSNNWNVGLLANTTGGAGDFHLISAASTNATNIKNSAGQVYGYEIYNANAAVRYVKLYNKASAPSVGTDTPFRTIGVPPNGRASFQTAMGLVMGTGISIATTTGIADSDNNAVGASDLSIDIDYK